MPAYTSTKTGNWSDPTTWGGTVGGPVPGAGDTATLAAGHTVTVDLNTTVGLAASASFSLDVTINTTSFLVINSGVTFQVNGSILILAVATVNDAIKLNAGATLVIDALPTFEQGIQWNTASQSNGRRFVAAGTAGQRCTVRKGPSAGVVRFKLGRGTGGTFIASYTDFSGLGSASVNAVTNTTCATFDVQFCVWDGCGAVGFTNTGGTYTFNYRDNVHKNTLGNVSMNASLGGTMTSGLRDV